MLLAESDDFFEVTSQSYRGPGVTFQGAVAKD